MKTKITLAALALAAVTLAMPASAEAGFHKRGWCKPDRVFSWLHRGCACKKVVVKRYGKRVRKAKKVMK